MKLRTVIIIIIVLLILLIFTFITIILGNNLCEKREPQERCLKEIANKYCSSINKSYFGDLTRKESCYLTLPSTFKCVKLENERSTNIYSEGKNYRFLNEEVGKCLLVEQEVKNEN